MVNAFQPTYGGSSRDGFVTKLNAAGTGVLYSTYLGGSSDDTAKESSTKHGGHQGFEMIHKKPFSNFFDW